MNHTEIKPLLSDEHFSSIRRRSAPGLRRRRLESFSVGAVRRQPFLFAERRKCPTILAGFCTDDLKWPADTHTLNSLRTRGYSICQRAAVLRRRTLSASEAVLCKCIILIEAEPRKKRNRSTPRMSGCRVGSKPNGGGKRSVQRSRFWRSLVRADIGLFALAPDPSEAVRYSETSSAASGTAARRLAASLAFVMASPKSRPTGASPVLGLFCRKPKRALENREMLDEWNSYRFFNICQPRRCSISILYD